MEKCFIGPIYKHSITWKAAHKRYNNPEGQQYVCCTYKNFCRDNKDPLPAPLKK